MYNYKNRGPFPPGKLNFHHKTSWPQTKKSILDHVIIRDNAVPPEALLPRCRTVQAIQAAVTLRSISNRVRDGRFPQAGARVSIDTRQILYSFQALIISLKLSVIIKRILRIHQDTVSMKRRRKMSSVSSHAEVMKRQNNYATSAVLHICISFFLERGGHSAGAGANLRS